MVTGYPMPYAPEPRPKDIDPVKQVEYYFSPDNLTNDRFLRGQMNKDGWVDLNVIFKFKRIQTLEITFDDFLNRLLTSELLDIDSEKKIVRTKSEPEKWWLDPSAKSPSPSLESASPPVSQFPHGNDQYNYNPGYSGVGPNNSCGPPFPPMFFSFPGYSNNSGRSRYSSHYNAGYYSTSNTNEEFNEASESGLAEQYASYSQSDYQADKAQELLVLQQRQSEDVDELSKTLSDLNVAKKEAN
ncbi:hypothetical protein MXB_4494 [Myxobolus squamalis]|nr:hypothetical protein MXB_4494 [Myxobolus squamalis]